MAKSGTGQPPTAKPPPVASKRATPAKPKAHSPQEAPGSGVPLKGHSVAAKTRAKATTQATHHNQDGLASEDLQVAVGANLRAARLAAGLTLRQVAELTGITFQYLGKVEKGGKNLTLSTMEALAVVLHVRISDLLPKNPP